MATPFHVTTVETKPIEGQKMGTSGLRKKVVEFQKPHYLHNFVQACFDCLPADKLHGSTLVVSGDGRYFGKEACQIIIKMAAANGVRRVWVGQGGIMSTPAVSAVIRNRVGEAGDRPYGAFVLTASHNPGGPTNDFGIKYNCENGGPAPESLTGAIYEATTKIQQYKVAADLPDVDLNTLGRIDFTCLPECRPFDVVVIDPTETWTALMKTIFDFSALKAFIARPDFKFVYDAMHGVAGPYAQRIFATELGAPASALLNCVPKEDFGGGHPDPNLTYAHELVHAMGLDAEHPVADDSAVPDFGAAADGDADRNMVLGKRFFVTPSDSVAILAANAQASIPYFKDGLKGVARSMPTSAALDVVGQKAGLKYFEVPTGWKFFGNLMDAGMCSICGEESFGTGSDHVREKDGLWAVLAWLSVLAHRNKGTPVGSLVTVEDIVRQHWATYGRHYYCRYDYEEVDAAPANKLMAAMVEMQADLASVNEVVAAAIGDGSAYKVVAGDQFCYTDPVDHSVSKNQGIRFLFEDGSRLVFRLSGTGSVGATIRLYIEQYEKDADKLGRDTHEALAPLVKIALAISKMEEYTGRTRPTVIT
eukprot:jgi/Mesvir1/5842/Mv00635-RA.1